MKPLLICAALLTAAWLTGCASSMTPGSATEAAHCEIWGKSLPTRSRADTGQTKAEIQRGYAAFDLACPGFGYLVPG
ncbi:hypothetical protein [Pseudogemmobacter faecipullorum]|uniref:Lipoprotein n=1 Tax=Pseudogemmobacter faecipullorum TaxID=2755041 RepID=A0ABS8CSG1_9RHOB|nr:hypothetical protein [Pseudogemmobacter faecipullorum]MCB5412338.1 hypothetical protein [Pseudogemmobacter faecipullorum]